MIDMSMNKKIWERARPKNLGEPKKLSSGEKKSAQASARRSGRPYPNLIDNMNAAKKK
jgi:hypothetical protein